MDFIIQPVCVEVSWRLFPGTPPEEKPDSQFAGCFGSTLMGLILSMIVEGALTDNLGNSVKKSCSIYYELNSAKHHDYF